MSLIRTETPEGIGAEHEINLRLQAKRRAGDYPTGRSMGISTRNIIKIVVSTIHTPRLRRPKIDPHLQAAGERVKTAAEELERLGIADKSGKRVRTDLSRDLREGADRDFGG